ncbi:MAG: hypothetical protein AB7W59_26150, partial [Acidimicrobiia bacterium]
MTVAVFRVGQLDEIEATWARQPTERVLLGGAAEEVVDRAAKLFAFVTKRESARVILVVWGAIGGEHGRHVAPVPDGLSRQALPVIWTTAGRAQLWNGTSSRTREIDLRDDATGHQDLVNLLCSEDVFDAVHAQLLNLPQCSAVIGALVEDIDYLYGDRADEILRAVHQQVVRSSGEVRPDRGMIDAALPAWISPPTTASGTHVRATVHSRQLLSELARAQVAAQAHPASSDIDQLESGWRQLAATVQSELDLIARRVRLVDAHDGLDDEEVAVIGQLVETEGLAADHNMDDRAAAAAILDHAAGRSGPSLPDIATACYEAATRLRPQLGVRPQQQIAAAQRTCADAVAVELPQRPRLGTWSLALLGLALCATLGAALGAEGIGDAVAGLTIACGAVSWTVVARSIGRGGPPQVLFRTTSAQRVQLAAGVLASTGAGVAALYVARNRAPSRLLAWLAMCLALSVVVVAALVRRRRCARWIAALPVGDAEEALAAFEETLGRVVAVDWILAQPRAQAARLVEQIAQAIDRLRASDPPSFGRRPPRDGTPRTFVAKRRDAVTVSYRASEDAAVIVRRALVELLVEITVAELDSSSYHLLDPLRLVTKSSEAFTGRWYE